MEAESKIKLFVLANSLVEHSLDKVEQSYKIDLGRKEKEPIKEQDYYAQFDSAFRIAARVMSKHYEVFYCLERSIRGLIVQIMKEQFGEGWWESKVNPIIQKNVIDNMKRE